MHADGVVIVGAGQGGFQVACSLRENGYAEPITLIGDEASAPYQRPPLSKAFVLGEATTEQLLLRPLSFYEQNSIRLISGQRVVEIDRRGRKIVLGAGGFVPYDRLVIATGTRNRALPVPGGNLENVLYLRTLSDADAIRACMTNSRSIVVIGAGFIGLELAAVASKLGKSVHIVDLLDRVMRRSVDPRTSSVFEQAHRSWGNILTMNASVRQIHGAKGQVAGVELKDGRVLEADLVLVGIGVVANSELAVAAGLDVADGILVDERLQTKDAAIFAIGDCARYPSRFADQTVRLESVQNAVDQARCVAAAIVGREYQYKAVPWFWSDQRDLKLQIVGLSCDCDTVIVRGSVVDRRFSIYSFRNERLCSIESVNHAADHMFGRRLMSSGALLTPKDLTDTNFNPKDHLAKLGP